MDMSIHIVKAIKLQPIKKLKRDDGHEFYVRRIQFVSEEGSNKITLFSEDKETLRVIEGD